MSLGGAIIIGQILGKQGKIHENGVFKFAHDFAH